MKTINVTPNPIPERFSFPSTLTNPQIPASENGAYFYMNSLASAKEIKQQTIALARELKDVVDPERLLVCPIATGGIYLANDLIRALVHEEVFGLSCSLATKVIVASSWPAPDQHDDEVSVSFGSLKEHHVRDRTVLAIDDVADTGKTFEKIVSGLHEMGAERVITVAAFDKRTERTFSGPDYALFSCHKENWLVGYGLDLYEKFRHLRGVFHIDAPAIRSVKTFYNIIE